MTALLKAALVCAPRLLLALLAVPAISLAAAAQNGPAAFAQVLGPAPIEFPRDHGPHPQFRQEWWYFTGNLDGPSGERFGFELTFFRVALVPNPEHQGWRAQQFYFAHFALTDRDRGVFHSAQRFARDALDLAGARSDPFRVWLQSWSVVQEEKDPGAWNLAAAEAGYSLNLRLVPGLPVLNGDRGFSRKSDKAGGASFYYSIPRIRVAGSLTRAGTTLRVSGLSWLDREWGSGELEVDEEGWDWFALQLQDGSSLMYYQLRNRKGGRSVHSAGTWIDARGVATALDASAVTITARSTWDSPRGGRYPADWRLRLPAQGLELEIHPILSDQELDVSPRYWEGAVDVRGTAKGRPIAGRGYVELVGYARHRE